MDPEDMERYDAALDVILNRITQALDSLEAHTFAPGDVMTATVTLPTPLEGALGGHVARRLGAILTPRGYALGYTTGAQSLTLSRIVSAGGSTGRPPRAPEPPRLDKHTQAGLLFDALLGALDIGLYEGWSRAEILGTLGLVVAIYQAVLKIYGSDRPGT